MGWVCPACGHKNDEDAIVCMCGFHLDESVPTNSGEDPTKEEALTEKQPYIIDTDAPATQLKAKNIKIKITGKPALQRRDRPPGETVIREIDSWQFSFSPADQCIYLGTPALKAFRLKLALEDLEEIIEFMYEKHGKNRTMRKLQLSDSEISELVEIVDTMIEEKKSKIRIKFSEEELRKIAEIINERIKL